MKKNGNTEKISRAVSGRGSAVQIAGRECLGPVFYRWFANRRYHIAKRLGLKKKNDQAGRHEKNKP